MGIPFNDEVALLAADLERAGFGEPRVVAFPYVPARRLELHLAGGLIVSFDRWEGLLFVEGGPSPAHCRVERFLESREKRVPSRVWSFMPRRVKAAMVAVFLLAAGAYAALHFEATPAVDGTNRTTITDAA